MEKNFYEANAKRLKTTEHVRVWTRVQQVNQTIFWKQIKFLCDILPIELFIFWLHKSTSREIWNSGCFLIAVVLDQYLTDVVPFFLFVAWQADAEDDKETQNVLNRNLSRNLGFQFCNDFSRFVPVSVENPLL